MLRRHHVHYDMRRFSFILLPFLLTACVSTTDMTTSPSETWRLAYAHDEDGTAQEGSKSDLITAVRAGKPVRIYTGGRRVEHVMDAGFLTIFEGEVFAQVAPINSQRPAMDPHRMLFREAGQHWRTIRGTNGTVTALMDGSEPRERTGATSWFVQD